MTDEVCQKKADSNLTITPADLDVCILMLSTHIFQAKIHKSNNHVTQIWLMAGIKMFTIT